jgi:type I restriction enzyme S subunit
MGKWQLIPLGKITTVVSGSTPKTTIAEYWNGEYNWVTPAELDDTVIVINETKRKITNKAIIDTGLKQLPIGTVLLSSRAPIGKVAITGTEMYCNQGIKGLVCSKRIYNRFLYWFLKGKTYLLNSLGRGATFKEISKTIVENLLVPLPPIEIQNHIAKALDTTSELLALRKQQLAELDNLIKSIFYDLIGDPFRNSKGWDKYKLSDVAEVIMGQSPKGSSYNALGNGIPLLNGPTEFGNKYPIEKQWTDEPTKISKAGDILFCVRGATAGRMNISDKEYCIGRGLAAIRPKKDKMQSYIFLYLKMMYSYFQSTSNGSTFINISKEKIEKIPFLKVDNETLQAFSSFVYNAEEQKALVQQAIDETQHLFDSLMSEYFD